MKRISQVMKICQYQIRILSRNYKIYTIPVCIFIFMINAVAPLRDFLNQTNENATPFLFPFLFSDTWFAALLFGGVLLFFIDAPFYDKQQLFVVTRSGVGKWTVGQGLYVFAISFFYMIFLLFMSVILLLPKLSLSGEWGRVWTTLVMTDAAEQLGFTGGLSGDIIFNYSPLQVTFLVFALGVLICTFYGLLVWCLNLYVGKIVSLVIALFSICLVTRVQFFPSWVMYLVPSGWANISSLSSYAQHRITIERAVLMLVFGIACLAIIAYQKTARYDIAK